MPDSIKVAFIGCAHPHIFPRSQALQAEPGVTIVGCYDPDPQLAAGIEQRTGIKAYETPESLLDQPGVNFVICEGWDTDNPRYARMAIARGQALMVEKPGAPNLTEMRALIDDLNANPVPFQIGYMLHFSPALEHVHRILNDGVLGPITLARFHAASPVGGAAEKWQSVPGDTGGVVYTDGCHMVDVIIDLLGVPKAAKGMLLKLPEGPKVMAHGFKENTLSEFDVSVQMPLGNLMYEDAGTALLEYDDKLVTFDVTGWEAQPWVEAWKIELYGVDGTLAAGLNPPWYALYVRNPKKGYKEGWTSWREEGEFGVDNSLVVDSNYTNETKTILDRVRRWDTNNTPWITAAEGTIAVLDAIFASAQSGASVPVKMR